MARQNRFTCDNHTGRDTVIVTIFCLALSGLLYVTGNRQEPLTLSVGCRECHYPVIKTLKGYKDELKRRRNMDKDILADLVANP